MTEPYTLSIRRDDFSEGVARYVARDVNGTAVTDPFVQPHKAIEDLAYHIHDIKDMDLQRAGVKVLLDSSISDRDKSLLERLLQVDLEVPTTTEYLE